MTTNRCFKCGAQAHTRASTGDWYCPSQKCAIAVHDRIKQMQKTIEYQNMKKRERHQ